jgi:hypothetical protein
MFESANARFASLYAFDNLINACQSYGFHSHKILKVQLASDPLSTLVHSALEHESSRWRD